MDTRRTSTGLSDSTYVELVRSLFGTFPQSAIMGGLFALTAAACAMQTHDQRLTVVAVTGTAIAVLRLALLVKLRSPIASRSLDATVAAKAETAFAVVYLSFAAAVGLYSALAFYLCPMADHVIVAVLLVGYAAGVAAGVSLRPWIAVPALTIAVLPSILVSIAVRDAVHLLLAAQLAALSGGAVASMLRRYRLSVEMIEMRQLFASLAHRDRLTGIANRLELENAFATLVSDFGGRGIVIHALDLDHFKPVNDLYGHAVGDLLLKAVAGRLERLVREGDLAVRLGGDEFAVLQSNVHHPDEAELMARRIAQRLSEPYTVGGHSIRIGACVGSASSDRDGTDLDHLLGIADGALYEAKRRGRPIQAIAS